MLAPDEQLRNMPNCHIFASSHDVLLDDSVLFYNAAKKAGNNNIRLTIWYGGMHIEQAFAKHYDNVIKMPQRKRYLNVYSILVSSSLF